MSGASELLAPWSDAHGAAATAEIDAYLAAHGRPDAIEMLVPDLCGRLRGKLLPGAMLEKLASPSARLPVSTYALNLLGEDVAETGLAIERGDPDGHGALAPRGLAPTPWRPGGAQALVSLRDPATGFGPCPYDPRAIVAQAAARLERLGFTPVVAVEFEFYLFEADGDDLKPARGLSGAQVYDLAALDRCRDVLDGVAAACAAQDLPAEAALAEFGPAQFEINLRHGPDALRSADEAALFRRAARGAAAAAGLEACFMAQPLTGAPGNGLHVHLSLLDRDGAPAFAAREGEEISDLLRWAIGGQLAAMRDLQILFAPSLNSYRRLAGGDYAPTAVTWGVDHRAAAVRAPETHGPGARLEHRIAGADASPHLAVAAILGAARLGVERRIEPGPPSAPGGGGDGPRLHLDWRAALDSFERSELAEAILGAEVRRVIAAMRRSEIAAFDAEVTEIERRLCRSVV